MGGSSGLAPLSREVAARWGEGFRRAEIPAIKTTLATKAGRRLRKLFYPPTDNTEWLEIRDKWSPFYRENAWRLEKAISQQVGETTPDFVFLESIEDQLFLLSQERKTWPKTRLAGITHQPPAWWRLHHRRPEMVSSLDLLVVYASGIKSFWAQYIDPAKIVFLPYAVATEFFVPLKPGAKPPAPDQALRVVFSGQWLRDFETLAEVVKMAGQQAFNVTFDLIVPHSARQKQECYQMAMSPKVRWHAQLSDEELRATYQQADVLLLTLTDAGANSALLEGMACGLPWRL